MNTNAPVCIPTSEESPFGILRGSAIVGRPGYSGGRVKIYFEGNMYGAADLHRFVARCLIAHGRMTQDAPTIARAWVPLEAMMQVGDYDPARRQVRVTRPENLAVWLLPAPLTASELVYRNPVPVNSVEHFQQLADTETPGEFTLALNGGLRSSKICRWTDGTFSIRHEIDGTEEELSPDLVSASLIGEGIRRRTFFYLIPDVPWGVGWE